ncbi:MAG: hypothetical protein ACRC33_01430 [Gemmataceae bacterium]
MTRWFIRGLSLFAALSFLALAPARAGEGESARAKIDLLDVAADLAAGRDVTAKVAAIRRR